MPSSSITTTLLSASLGAALMWLWNKKKSSASNKSNTNNSSLNNDMYDPDIISGTSDNEFNIVFDEFVEEFLHACRNDYEMDDAAIERLRRLLHYTCLNGKLNRGRMVISTVKDLCTHLRINFGRRKRQAMALGWCIEALQASFLVADDIMDASTTRRGQICWYLQPDIKLDAINDVLIIESFIYFLLKEYFENDSNHYVTLLELYREVSLKTQLGQMLDLVSNPQGRPKDDNILDTFTVELQRKIVQYKTAYYSFYLPIASGMILCNVSSSSQLSLAEMLSIELGVKFQIQDDYLDCYGDPEKIGKIGTDIKDHKCTWLLVQAMKRTSEEQMQIIRDNLGKDDGENAIKRLYDDLGLEQVYLSQEQTSYDRIKELLDKCKLENLPKSIFEVVLNKIHLRQK